jgi:hypothetical protein
MHDTNNSPQEESETVIVCGGISGLACALQLHKAQRHFTLITDCIGISCTGNGVCNGDWSNTIDSLTQGYADQIVNDKVLQISELSGGKGYQVSCDSKQYRGRNVVLAVPGASGQTLLDSLDASWNTNNQSNDAVEAISCHVFHITGKRRPLYRPKRSLLMGPTDDIKLFFPLPDGVDILYSSLAAPDFSRYYESHQIIAQRFWQPAIQLSKQSWRPLQPCSNFFTIGDHNICGLEDSYLTGLFAANRIIDKSNQAISVCL